MTQTSYSDLYLYPPAPKEQELLYRLEHRLVPSSFNSKFGAGPYGRGDGLEAPDICDFCDTYDRHPTWTDETGRGVDSDEFFGFGSVEQLREWFFEPDHRRKMHDAGFVVRVYYGDVAVSSRQATITASSARRLVTLTSMAWV